MTSLLTAAAQVSFEVLRRAGHTIHSSHMGQSICNTSKIANRKIQLHFENIHRGGHRFWIEIYLKFKMSYLLSFLRHGQTLFSF